MRELPGTVDRMPGWSCNTDSGCCGAPLPYVKVTEQGNIWIMLPGDNAGHMLAPGEARRLFRELEEVV